MTKYRIVKYVRRFDGDVSYRVQKKGWFFWHDMYFGSMDYPETVTFKTHDEARDWINAGCKDKYGSDETVVQEIEKRDKKI